MHLLESARTRLECIAVVHEVSAGIAAEYFNVAHRSDGKRAFALVTAGPGITNMATAIGGAWLESRELLIVGGQARTEFISHPEVRQIGHQQIDGRSIVEPMSNLSITITEPFNRNELKSVTDISKTGRKGPVFLEICLDVTAMEVDVESLNKIPSRTTKVAKELIESDNQAIEELVTLMKSSTRPLILVGGGLDFHTSKSHGPKLKLLISP